MTSRPATPADVPAVVEIERVSFADPWSEASFKALLDDGRVEFRVVENDGRLAGYVVMWAVADEGELANIAVAEWARGRGLGGRLLDDALAAAAGRGARNTYLEVRESNSAARKLYASHGFKEVRRRRRYYAHPEEDGIVMVFEHEAMELPDVR